ncbi:hypothetical protein PC116_g26359 [Phytophthora cactorum]|nr:hypothetical protein PC116_g26359 [Phytophthora cactorum]
MRPSYRSFAKRIQLMAGSDVNSDALVGGFSIFIDRYWRPVRVRVKTFNVSTLDVASDVCPADIAGPGPRFAQLVVLALWFPFVEPGSTCSSSRPGFGRFPLS